VGNISAALAATGDAIERRWGARVVPLRDELALLAGSRATPRGFDPADAMWASLTFARDRYPKPCDGADGALGRGVQVPFLQQ